MARERSKSQPTQSRNSRHYVPRGRSVMPGQGDRRRPSSGTPHLDRFRRYHRHPPFQRPQVAHNHALHDHRSGHGRNHHIKLIMHGQHHGSELNHRHDSPMRSRGEIPADAPPNESNIEVESDSSSQPSIRSQTERTVEMVGQEMIPGSAHKKARIVRATHLRELPAFESFPDNTTETEATLGYVIWDGVSGERNAIENSEQQRPQTLICGRSAEEIISLASNGMNEQLTRLKGYSRSLGVPSLQEVSASAKRLLPQQFFQDDEEHPFPSCLYPKPVKLALSARPVESPVPVEDLQQLEPQVVKRPHAHPHLRSNVRVSLMHEASHDAPEGISLKLLPDLIPETEPEPENIEMPSDQMPPPLEEEVEVRLLPVGDSKKFVAQTHCHKGLNTSAALMKTLSIRAYVGLEMAHQITLLTLKVLNKKVHIYAPIAAEALRKRYRIFLRKSAPVARHVKQVTLACLRKTGKGCVKQMKKHTLGKACISCLNLEYISRENSVQDLDYIDYMQHDIPDRPSHRDAELAWRESLRVYSVTPKQVTPRSRGEADESPCTHLLQLPDGSCTCPHYHDQDHDHEIGTVGGPVDALVPVTFVDPEDRVIEELSMIKGSSDFNANQAIAIIDTCTTSDQENVPHSPKPLGVSHMCRGTGHVQDEAISRWRRRLLSSPTSRRHGRGQGSRRGGPQGLGPLAWPPPEEIQSNSGDPYRDYILAAGFTVRPHRRVTDLLQKTPVGEEGLWRRTLRAYHRLEKPHVKPRPENVLLVRKPLKIIRKEPDATNDAQDLAIVEPGDKKMNNLDGASAEISALASYSNRSGTFPSSATDEREVKASYDHQNDDKPKRHVEYRQLQHVFGGGRAVHRRSPRAKVDSHVHKLDSAHKVGHERQSGRLGIDPGDAQLDSHKDARVHGGNAEQDQLIEEGNFGRDSPMQTSESNSNRARHGKRGHTDDTDDFGLEARHGDDHASSQRHLNPGPVLAQSSREDPEALLSSSSEASPPHAKRRNLEVLFPPEPHIVKPKFSKGPLILPPIHRLSSDRSKIASSADYGKDGLGRSLKTTPSGWSWSRQGTPRIGSKAEEIGPVLVVGSRKRLSSPAPHKKPSHPARLQQTSHGILPELRRRSRPQSRSPDQHPRENLRSDPGRKDHHRVVQSPHSGDEGSVSGDSNVFLEEGGGLGNLTLASLDRYAGQSRRKSGLFRRKHRVRSFSKKRTSRFSALKDGLLHYLPSRMLTSLRRSARLTKRRKAQTSPSRHQFRKPSSTTIAKVPSFFNKRGVTPSTSFQNMWPAAPSKHVTTVSDHSSASNARPPRRRSGESGSSLSKVLLLPSTSQHQEFSIRRFPRTSSENPPRLKIFLSKKDIENAQRGVMISAGPRSMQKRLSGSPSSVGGDYEMRTKLKKFKMVNTPHDVNSRNKGPEKTLDQGTFCNFLPGFSSLQMDPPSTSSRSQKPVSFMDMNPISWLRIPKFQKTNDLKSPSSSELSGHRGPHDQPNIQKRTSQSAKFSWRDNDSTRSASSPIKPGRTFKKRDTGYPGKFKLPRDVIGARTNARPNLVSSRSQRPAFPNQKPSSHLTQHQHPTMKDDNGSDNHRPSRVQFPDKRPLEDDMSRADSYREEEAKLKSLEDEIINEYLENLAPSPLAAVITDAVPRASGFSAPSQATDGNTIEPAPSTAETLSTSPAVPEILNRISHLQDDDGENEKPSSASEGMRTNDNWAPNGKSDIDNGWSGDSLQFDSEPELIPSATDSEPLTDVSTEALITIHGGDNISDHGPGPTVVAVREDEDFTRAEPDPNLTSGAINIERLSQGSVDDGQISEKPGIDSDDVQLKSSPFPEGSHSPRPTYAVRGEANHRKGDGSESEVLNQFHRQKSDKHDTHDEIAHSDFSHRPQDTVYVPRDEPSQRKANEPELNILEEDPMGNEGLHFLQTDIASSHQEVYERDDGDNISPEIRSHSEPLFQPTADGLDTSRDPGSRTSGSLDSSGEDVYHDQGGRSQTANGDSKFQANPFGIMTSSPAPQAGVSPSDQDVETDEDGKLDGNEIIDGRDHNVERSQTSTSQILPELLPAAHQVVPTVVYRSLESSDIQAQKRPSLPALQTHQIHSSGEVRGAKQYSAILQSDNNYVGEPTGGEVSDVVHSLNVDVKPATEDNANGSDDNLVEGVFGRTEDSTGAAPPQSPAENFSTLDRNASWHNPSIPLAKDGESAPFRESGSEDLSPAPARVGDGNNEMNERREFRVAAHGHHMEGEVAGEKTVRSYNDDQGIVLHEDEPVAREDPSEGLHSVAPHYDRQSEWKDPSMDGLVPSLAPISTSADYNSTHSTTDGAAEPSFQPVIHQMKVYQDMEGDEKDESDLPRTIKKFHQVDTGHMPVAGVSEDSADVRAEVDLVNGKSQSEERRDMMEFERLRDSALNLLREMETLETDLSVVSETVTARQPSLIDNQTRLSPSESHLTLNADGDDQGPGNDVHNELLSSASASLQDRLPELVKDLAKDFAVRSDENREERKPSNNEVERRHGVDNTRPGSTSTGQYNVGFGDLKDAKIANDLTTGRPGSYSHFRANSGDTVQNDGMEGLDKFEEDVEEDTSEGLQAAASEFLKELQTLGQLVPMLDPNIEVPFSRKQEDHGQPFEAHPDQVGRQPISLQIEENEFDRPSASLHDMGSSASGEGKDSPTTDDTRGDANEGTLSDVANLEGVQASSLNSQLFRELETLDKFVASLGETVTSNKVGLGEARQSRQQVDQNLQSDKRELEPVASHHATRPSETGPARINVAEQPRYEENGELPEEKNKLEGLGTANDQHNIRGNSSLVERREAFTAPILQSSEATMESDIMNIQPSAVTDRDSKLDLESSQHQFNLPFGSSGSQETDSSIVLPLASETPSTEPIPSNSYSTISMARLQTAEKLAAWEAMSSNLQPIVQRTAYDDTYIRKASSPKKDQSPYDSRNLLGLDLGGVSNAPASILSDQLEDIVANLKREYGEFERSQGPDTRIKITKSAEVIGKREIQEVKYSSRSSDNEDVEQIIEVKSSEALQFKSSSIKTSITREVVSRDRTAIDAGEDGIGQDQDGTPSPNAVPQIVLGMNSLPSSSNSSSKFGRSSIIDQDKVSALGFSNKVSAYELISSLGVDPEERQFEDNDKPEFTSSDVSETLMESEDLGARAANTSNSLDDAPREAGISLTVDTRGLDDNTKLQTSRPRIRSTFTRPTLKRSLRRTSETDRTIDRLQLEVGGNVSEAQFTATDVEQVNRALEDSETRSESGIASFENSDDLDGELALPPSRSRDKSLFYRPKLKKSLENPNDDSLPSAVTSGDLDAGSGFGLSVDTSESQDLDTSRGGTAAEPVRMLAMESMSLTPERSFVPTRSKSFVRPDLKKALLVRTSETDRSIARLQSEKQDDENFEDTRSELPGSSGYAVGADSTKESEVFESGSSIPDIPGAMDDEGKLTPTPSRSKSFGRPLLKNSLIIKRNSQTDDMREKLESDNPENENSFSSLQELRSKIDQESSSRRADGSVLLDISPSENKESEENLVSNRPRIKSTFVRPILDSRLIENLESGQNVSKLQSEKDQDQGQGQETFSSLAEKREKLGEDNIKSHIQDQFEVGSSEGPGLKLLLTPEATSPADSDTESVDGRVVVTRSTRNRSLYIRPSLKKSLDASLELEQMFAQLQRDAELEAKPIIEDTSTSTTSDNPRRPDPGDDIKLDRSRTFEGQSESMRTSESSSSVDLTAQSSQGSIPTDRVRKSVFGSPSLKRSLASNAETDSILTQLRSEKDRPPPESEDSNSDGAGRSEGERFESAASSLQDSPASVDFIDASTNRNEESFGQNESESSRRGANEGEIASREEDITLRGNRDQSGASLSGTDGEQISSPGKDDGPNDQDSSWI